VIAGHFGVLAALARARPGLSLWWLGPAAIAPDILDIVYAAAGVCNPSGLYSHTVPAALLLGAAIGGMAVLAGHRETGAASLALVMLHLPLDYVTGRKLLWPGGELHGLMLYDRPVANFALEMTLLAAGWILLRGLTGLPWWARNRWMIGLLVLVQGVSAAREDGIKPTACHSAVRIAPAAISGPTMMPGPSWTGRTGDFASIRGYGAA